MTNLAHALGRVMVTAVSLPRSKKEEYADYRKWAETEYRKDANYAYDCMIDGRPVDLR